MKIQYDVVEIYGREGVYAAAVLTPETAGRIGPVSSLKKLIETALTPDDMFSPRVKAAFVAIQKMGQQLDWDEAKIQAALPAN